MFSPAAVWPVATGGRAWIVSPDRYMTVIDTETGQNVWRFRDDAQWVRESLGMSEDSARVYAKTMQGNILAFRTDGHERQVAWQSPCNWDTRSALRLSQKKTAWYLLQGSLAW